LASGADRTQQLLDRLGLAGAGASGDQEVKQLGRVGNQDMTESERQGFAPLAHSA